MTSTSPASMGGPLSEAERAEVLVEGSWFKVEDLPQILGNYMRSASESNRQCKELSIKLREADERVGVLEGQLATAREELDSLELIAAPHRMTADQRERYRRHASWEGAEYYLKQAEAAARKWQREADWLREFRDTRKAETEAGTWPPPGDFGCCEQHPAKALGLDGGGSDER